MHDDTFHAELRKNTKRWKELPLIGFQRCAEVFGPGEAIELRNCPCGSTLGRRIKKEDSMKFEVYRDKAGEYRWRLLASNGKLTADSGEGYTRHEDAHRAIATMLISINDVVIVDA